MSRSSLSSENDNLSELITLSQYIQLLPYNSSKNELIITNKNKKNILSHQSLCGESPLSASKLRGYLHCHYLVHTSSFLSMHFFLRHRTLSLYTYDVAEASLNGKPLRQAEPTRWEPHLLVDTWSTARNIRRNMWTNLLVLLLNDQSWKWTLKWLSMNTQTEVPRSPRLAFLHLFLLFC